MKYLLFGVFVLVPIAEIATFIQVGDIIGLWPTIGVVILTAFIGTGLLRFQGMSALAGAQTSLNKGELPLVPVIHGVFLLIAGLLLLTPGFITDAIGFLLFIPPVRLAIAHWVIGRIRASKNVHVHGSTPYHEPENPSGAPIIEGDFTIAEEEIDDQSKPEKGQKGSSSKHSPWKQ